MSSSGGRSGRILQGNDDKQQRQLTSTVVVSKSIGIVGFGFKVGRASVGEGEAAGRGGANLISIGGDWIVSKSRSSTDFGTPIQSLA